MGRAQGRNAALASCEMSASDFAEYTFAQLQSLRWLALRNNQKLLAHLLDLASMEAKRNFCPMQTPEFLPASEP
jgi:hypothetical protein